VAGLSHVRWLSTSSQLLVLSVQPRTIWVREAGATLLEDLSHALGLMSNHSNTKISFWIVLIVLTNSSISYPILVRVAMPQNTLLSISAMSWERHATKAIVTVDAVLYQYCTILHGPHLHGLDLQDHAEACSTCTDIRSRPTLSCSPCRNYAAFCGQYSSRLTV
jgi:hypothetical protein